MAVIKLHLENEEQAALERLAGDLKVPPEELIFVALNQLMLNRDKSGLSAEVERVRKWRKDNLARWSDPARVPHVYESLPDEGGPKARH
jgi:hypothetical protein